MFWIALSLSCDGGDDKVDDQVDGDADTDADTDTDTDTDTDLPDLDGDGFDAEVDCDDADETVFPGAPDACGDDRVTDCDRSSDDGLVTIVGAASYIDLQDAFDAAAAEDALLICPGTYAGPFVAREPVHVSSHGGRDVTILSGGNAGPTLGLPGGSSIIGLTLQQGNAQARGGGLQLGTGGVLTIEDCVITDNRAELGGGISLFPGAQVTVRDSVISDNNAEVGGGIDASEGVTLDLTGTIVEGNQAILGGGIVGDAATITGGVLRGNVGAPPMAGMMTEDGGSGGGLLSWGDLTLTGTELDGNTSSLGGALYLYGDAVLLDVSIHDNTNGVFGYGAGVMSSAGQVELGGTTEIFENSGTIGAGLSAYGSTIIGGLVRDNQAQIHGGGLSIEGTRVEGMTVSTNHAPSGGGVQVGYGADLVGCTISANTADEFGGGIVAPYDDDGGGDDDDDTDTFLAATIGTDTGGGGFDPGPLVLTDTVVIANSAGEGGGIYSLIDLQVSGGSITDNLAVNTGGGIRILNDPALLNEVSIWRNSALTGGGIAFGRQAELSSVSSDWGAGADDNTPHDIWTSQVEVTGYGESATFDCNVDGCTPAP